MSAVKVNITVTSDNKVVKVNPGRIKVATVGTQGIPGPHMIQGAMDVDIEAKKEGSLMAYSESSDKWEATNELRNIKINCGSF